MLLIFIPFASGTIIAEQQGNPNFAKLGLALQPQINSYPGGNMEGKETRFGIVSSALWASATTASANGSVNAAHDSLMPVASLTTLWLMQLGEVIFGGVGSGLLSMLILVIITVFVAGLMVGRTPEYLGKKIEPYEMKMAAIAVLVMPFIVLLLTAIAVATRARMVLLRFCMIFLQWEIITAAHLRD
jgi:K+-transporting ATPase ATPase A chain